MTVIDVWAQVTTERMAQAPWLAPLLRWTNQDGGAPPSAQDTVAAMDQAGVSTSFLSAWCGPQGWLITNEEVSAAIDVAPDRFRGLASADISRPMDAVRDIRRWVDGERFVGVRVLPWLWDRPPNHRWFYPIYAVCVELGVPFCTQIGHTGPLMRSEPGRLVPYLEEVMLDFPDLVVVGGHVGFPWIDELHTMTIKFPNFYVDTSAYATHRLPPAFVDYMKSVGSGRVMFGTNWPMLTPSQCLKGVEGLGLTERQRDAYLAGVAQQVFGLSA